MFLKLFLVMTLLTFQSVFCKKLKKTVKKLEADAVVLEGRVHVLEGEHDTLETRLGDLEEEIEEIDKPRDCQDVQNLGNELTGLYTIYPTYGVSFEVRCDMDTAGGGWTVIQRRVSDSDFYKTWDDYKVGFGDLDVNFWLGNEKIHTLTNAGSYRLRVDLTAPDGDIGYITYNSFSIGSEDTEYGLSVSNDFNGNIGDGLHALHHGMAFSTKDRDNDEQTHHCAEQFSGAWWYGPGCHYSNLNGVYGSTVHGTGLNWGTWKDYSVSMTSTQLAIKRG